MIANQICINLKSKTGFVNPPNPSSYGVSDINGNHFTAQKKLIKFAPEIFGPDFHDFKIVDSAGIPLH